MSLPSLEQLTRVFTEFGIFKSYWNSACERTWQRALGDSGHKILKIILHISVKSPFVENICQMYERFAIFNSNLPHKEEKNDEIGTKPLFYQVFWYFILLLMKKKVFLWHCYLHEHRLKGMVPKNIHKRLLSGCCWYKHALSYIERSVYSMYPPHYNNWIFTLKVVNCHYTNRLVWHHVRIWMILKQQSPKC